MFACWTFYSNIKICSGFFRNSIDIVFVWQFNFFIKIRQNMAHLLCQIEEQTKDLPSQTLLSHLSVLGQWTRRVKEIHLYVLLRR